MLKKVVVGAGTLDNLTISMYKNARIVFREYIQNSTDSIDNAVKVGILREGEGKITVTIDEDNRNITIEDNGTGISALNFDSKLLDIGNSDKKRETDRGQRGIGRLCGLAYCKTLIFTSTAKGETVKSVLTFDAKKLNDMLNDGKKYTAEIIINSVITFEETNVDANEHFFKVELLDVTNDILLNVEDICDYLSFVAPVPYSPKFEFRKKIYAHAAEIGFKITEYDIRVNDKPIFKNYKEDFSTQMGADKIFGLEFRDIYNDDGELIAWSWVGLSTFKGVIQQTKSNPNQMRSIRLRQKNIQIGDEMVFQDRKLFSEDRGTTYFIGEIHAVDTNLRPNSQRDYFVENDACEFFEGELKNYFEVLTKLYRYASKIRSAFKAVNEPKKFLEELELHTPEYRETHKAEHDAEFTKLIQKANEKQKFIDEARQAAKANPEERTSRVFEQIAAANSPITPPPHTTRLPLPNWSLDKTNLYNEIYEIILANKKLSGTELIKKFEEVLR